MLAVDEYYGMTLAVAACAQELSGLIVGNMLAQERGDMPLPNVYPDSTRRLQDTYTQGHRQRCHHRLAQDRSADYLIGFSTADIGKLGVAL